MRHDPVELSCESTRVHRRNRRVRARRGDAHATERIVNSLPSLDVLDEAFAGFTRVDSGTSQVTMHGPSAAREAIAALCAQLTALDRQREQLSRLLQSVDELPA